MELNEKDLQETSFFLLFRGLQVQPGLRRINQSVG